MVKGLLPRKSVLSEFFEESMCRVNPFSSALVRASCSMASLSLRRAEQGLWLEVVYSVGLPYADVVHTLRTSFIFSRKSGWWITFGNQDLRLWVAFALRWLAVVLLGGKGERFAWERANEAQGGKSWIVSHLSRSKAIVLPWYSPSHHLSKTNNLHILYRHNINLLILV